MQQNNQQDIWTKIFLLEKDLLENQKKIAHKGGTMRLGAYPCKLEEGSRVYSIYNSPLISERHRHRYEFNNEYLSRFKEAGMQFSGINPDAGLVEIIELQDHPFFIAVQFHPEYKSRPDQPHPLFKDFMQAVRQKSQIKEKKYAKKKS